MTTTVPDAPTVSPLPTPETTRWRPTRAGLQDVWQYDHTTRFVFHRGRLLLRGRNGSGKTKVVEVLLPFLLEGRLHPSRLDPFGTRSRKMHYNILPPDADAASAIGYVWLEFARRDDDGRDRYATIGAGLKARRSSDGVESWFFVVHDRRVDVDLSFLDDDRRPLGRPALTEVVGDDGVVLDSARDYRAAVNRALFGAEPDQYDALVEALLRLRQPHLSERLDPDEVGEVLTDSLPPLDADRVHEVAEGFERLEAHRRDLDDRRRTLAAVDQFLGDYRTYARTVAAVRARSLTRADSTVRATADRVTAADEAHDIATTAAEELGERLATTEASLDAARTRIHTLETSDEYRAVQQLEEAEDALTRDRARAEAADTRYAEAENAHDEAHATAEDAATDVARRRESADVAHRDATIAAARAELRDAQATLDGLVGEDHDTDPATGALTALHDDRHDAIATVRAAVAEVDRARAAEADACQRREDLAAEADDRTEELRAAETAVHEAVDAHRDRLRTWARDCTVLALDDASLDAVVDRDPTEVPAAVRDLTGPQRDVLEHAVGDADAAAREVGDRLADVRAEHDALSAATHEPPPGPGWQRSERAGRAGAPLYLLVELDDALDDADQAGIEAALQAAGLLDAWVIPDGRLLDAGTHDVVALPAPPVVGRSLGDVAHPIPTGGVPPVTVTGILRSVALVESDDPSPDADAWVAADGRFRLGPLHGRGPVDRLAYLGETARRRARERRLAQLATRIEQLDVEVEAARERLETARDRRRGFDADLDGLPTPDDVLAARARVTAATGHLEEARSRLRAADQHLATCVEDREDTERQRDAVADEHGLGASVDRLDELADALTAWRGAARQWLHAVDRLADAARRHTDLDAVVARAAERLRQAGQEQDGAHRDRDRSAARAATLREAVGATRDDLLAALASARADEDTLSAETRQLHQQQVELAQRVGATEGEQHAAREAHDAARDDRALAADGVRILAQFGVLAHVVDTAPPDDPATWSIRTALEQAREVGRVAPAVPDDPDAVEARLSEARNRLARRQQELLRELVAGIRLLPTDHRGVIVYEAQHQGRSYRLDGLVTELRDDVAERDARLHDDEQELLEAFLAGELHEHLRSRIRDATSLVEAMNDQLARCRTAAGQQLRLRWRVDQDAPPATEQAVELLLRGSGLLTEDQRGQLRTYLHERLREAREGDATHSLFERIAGAFDYRRWHRFTIQYRDRGQTTWRRLTRQAHGTGSGGEKAVMLHLPLFAAMAAHYHARPTAPRLIVLDEVFAGIDRGTRGQLMGLLVELDLDVLLTSHEEWGFYRELDGISTYHLIRDPDVPGVLAEWFVWDGAQRWEMDAS